MENADSGLGNPASAVGQVVQHLAGVISDQMDRNAFFQVLTEQLRTFFHYDRCCINLYDAEREFLNLFTAADGTVVESLANTRVARNTVAGLAIASKKPVLINDLAAQNLGDGPMPLSSVGLNATIALPLIINREVIATLHVSFVRQPGNVVEILRFLIGLCPVVTTFLYAVLADERDNKSRATLAPNDAELASRLLKTPSMSRVMGIANQVAKLNIPVLITGETGTGKSVLAHWLHRHSPRHEENFVKVNCPSIAPSLFESEMFGHARGAFTGATTKRIGRVELAQHGTLFLDEIGELAPEMQSKLLQVLEENSFERVGETTSVEVDIRLIAATNIDPELAMREGRLRPDLYYRLGSVIVPMPPLRTRKNDIPLFTEYFVHQFAKQHEITPPHLAPSVLQALQGHPWPGNIRELRNVVTRILLHSLHGAVTENFVRETLRLHNPLSLEQRPMAQAGSSNIPHLAATDEALPTLAENERRLIEKALACTGGRISGPNGAAAQLGIPRGTLQHRMRKLGIRTGKDAIPSAKCIGACQPESSSPNSGSAAERSFACRAGMVRQSAAFPPAGREKA